MAASHAVQSVREGDVICIRTDGRIWKEIKRKMIRPEMQKAEKPDIFYL